MISGEKGQQEKIFWLEITAEILRPNDCVETLRRNWKYRFDNATHRDKPDRKKPVICGHKRASLDRG